MVGALDPPPPIPLDPGGGMGGLAKAGLENVLDGLVGAWGGRAWLISGGETVGRWVVAGKRWVPSTSGHRTR